MAGVRCGCSLTWLRHYFDHNLCILHRCRFLNSDEATRNTMFKLIPHIANGSWVIRQSVGSTPVIIGKVGAGGRRGTVRVARGKASGS